MKKPVVINTATIAAMPPFEAMPEMPGRQRPSARSAEAPIPEDQGASSGIWECTEGAFRRQITKREFSHFLEGRCTFTPDGGEPVEINAGDAVYFPANCFGTWNVLQAIRKTFIVLD